MIGIIKKYIRQQKISSFAQFHKRTTSFMGFGQIQKVLLLFDGTNLSRLSRINAIIESLTQEGKYVKALAFYDDKALADICLTQDKIEFICNREFDWYGFPQEMVSDTVLTNSYDLVLYIDMVKRDEVATLLDMVDCSFKAGKAGILPENKLDLVINMPEDKDETFLVEQIIYYLRRIKSKG